MLAGAGQACLGRSAAPDRRPARPVRRRSQGTVGDLPATVPVHRIAGPEGLAESKPFHHSADPLLERHAGRLELGSDVGHIGGDADAHDEAPLADLIQSRDQMRQDHRVAQGRQQDRRPQLDPGHPPGNAGQQGQGFVPRPRQQGIANPDRIEPGAFRPFRKRQQGRGVGFSLHDLLAGRQQVSQLYGHRWRPSSRYWLRGRFRPWRPRRAPRSPWSRCRKRHRWDHGT